MADLPIRLEHRPGSNLLLADHASRHPATCKEKTCQLCDFVNDEVESANILTGVFNIDDNIPIEAPFLQLKTWKTIQFNDSTHTRLKELIRNGQTPIKKKTGGQETVLKLLHTHFTKKSLKNDPSGVIMIKQKHGHYDGYSISVPTSIFPGFVYAYHNKCSHPTKSQMLKLMSRYFYCPGMQNIIDKVTDSCLQCVATSKIPKEVIPDSSRHAQRARKIGQT